MDTTIEARGSELDESGPAPRTGGSAPLEHALGLLAPAIVDQVTNGVVVTDERGTIEYVNPAFCRITGYTREALLGGNPRVLKSGRQSDTFYRGMWSELAAGKPFSTVFENRRADGSVYLQKSTISPIRDPSGRLRYVGVTQDVTRERALEEQVHRSHKLEALGRFTSTIAHDFNNILAVIISGLQYMSIGFEEDGRDHTDDLDLIDEAIAAVDRGSDLVRRLMAYARSESSAPEPHHIAHVLARTGQLVQRLLPESVAFELDIDVGDTVCHVDPVAFDQTLMNMATNARDAMDGRGTLRIAARVRTDAVPWCTLEGPHVHVEIADDGRGMDEATQKRIFDPFFTTKAPGEGTGLGLAMAHAMVEEVGGGIAVESIPDEGTTFHLCLPIADVGSTPTAVAGRAVDPVVAAHVLVIEDAEPVRRASQRALESIGHSVVAVPDAEKALILLAGTEHPFDLVVSDVVLPRMSGVELYRRLDSDTRPPFLFVTGHIDAGESCPPESILLHKPWTIDEMGAAIGETLATAGTVGGARAG